MKLNSKRLTAILLSTLCLITAIPQTPDTISAATTASTKPAAAKGASVEGNLAVCDNAKYIYNFFITEMGLNSAAACGILANIRKESAFNPQAYSADDGGSGYPSYGLCQWHDTGVDKGRFTNLKNWCAANGYDYTTLDGQLNFLRYELSQNSNKVLYNGKKIYTYLQSVENSAEGAYSAGWYWCYYFEVPAKKDTTSIIRGNSAKDIYWPAYCQPSIGNVIVGDSNVSLSWSAFPNASSYELYRYQNNDPSTAASLGTISDLSYVDYTIGSGVVYTYFLRVYIPQGDGSILSVDSTPVTAYYLATPTISSVVGTDVSITPSWAPVSGATLYQVFRNENGGEYAQIATTSDAFYTDTSVSANIKYRYVTRAVATFPDGSSAYSGYSNEAACYVLTQPVINSVKITNGSLKVKWDKVAHAKQYVVYRKTNDSGYEALATVTGSSYTDSDISSGKTYKYKVKAQFVLDGNILSTSKASLAASQKFSKGPVLNSMTSPGSKAITLKWAKNKGVAGYEICYATNSKFSKSQTLIIVGDSSVAWTIRNLSKGKTYYAKIRTYSKVNGKKVYSSWSNTKKLKLKK